MEVRGKTAWWQAAVLGGALCCGLALGSPVEAQQAGGREVPFVRVLVQFRQPPGPDQEALIRRMGGNVERSFKIVPAVAATLPAPALQALALHRDIVTIEEDVEVEAHDLNATWGVKRIGCGPVHDGTYEAGAVGITGTGVRVAICDTGIDYNHPELAANYAGGKDFVTGDSNPIDEQYHGTHVAGTVAAAWNGTGVVGAAPNARLYACRVLDANGSGSYSYIIAALDWCVANQIQVANFSLGSSGYPGTTVEQAFANAEAAGIVLIASAGNSGAGTDTVGYPAKFSSCIAVASTDSADLRSSFSSTGPAVEIAAPGSSILSTYPGNRLATLSGTSMAAPHVTGVAALMLEKGVADANGNGRVNDDLRAVLALSATDLGAGGRDNSFGFGLVNASLAVSLSGGNGGGGGGGDPPPIFDPPSQLAGSVNRSRVVSLQWQDNSNCEDGFEIQYGTSRRGVTTWQGSWTVGADVRTATRTMSRGTWQFRVRAIQIDPNAATAWSNQIQVNVK